MARTEKRATSGSDQRSSISSVAVEHSFNATPSRSACEFELQSDRLSAPTWTRSIIGMGTKAYFDAPTRFLRDASRPFLVGRCVAVKRCNVECFCRQEAHRSCHRALCMSRRPSEKRSTLQLPTSRRSEEEELMWPDNTNQERRGESAAHLVTRRIQWQREQ